MFSDVRNGVPANGSCKDSIVHAVGQKSVIWAVVLLVIGVIGFTGLAMSFSICYLQRKSYQGKQFYNSAKWGTSKND